MTVEGRGKGKHSQDILLIIVIFKILILTTQLAQVVEYEILKY